MNTQHPVRPASADGLTHRERAATAIPQSYIATTTRIATVPITCATCRALIDVGSPYREDRLRQPVHGVLLASAICSACTAEGL